jgi:hypothetical protein
MITDEIPEGLDYVRFGDPQAPDENVLQLVPGGYKIGRGGRGVVVKVKAGYQLAYDPDTDTSTVDKPYPSPLTATITVTLKSAKHKASLNKFLKNLQKDGVDVKSS